MNKSSGYNIVTFLKENKSTNALSFYRSQNVLCWSKFFVSDQKFIYILWQSRTFCARQKDDLHSVKIGFCASTKVFEEALNAVKFLGWLKKFGPVQNILGPVKGQRKTNVLSREPSLAILLDVHGHT